MPTPSCFTSNSFLHNSEQNMLFWWELKITKPQPPHCGVLCSLHTCISPEFWKSMKQKFYFKSRKIVQSSCNIYLAQLERDLVTKKTTIQAKDHFQQLLPETKSNLYCGNHVSPREVGQSRNSYKRNTQMWLFFSHLNCNELEKTRLWWSSWWWWISYPQVKDTKLPSLLAVTIQ